MLHLAGRIALGVDVRDLLQLERALERDRVVHAAAEEQEVRALVEALRDVLDLRLGAQRLLEVPRQLRERLADAGAPASARQRAARRPRCSASRSRATSCVVKALVDATPISGPACV